MNDPSDFDRESDSPKLPVDFEVFFQQEYKAFLQFARKRLRSVQDAEEVVLDASARIFKKWDEALSHPNPVALAYKILDGFVADYWRQLSRRREDPVAEPPSPAYFESLRPNAALEHALDTLRAIAPLQAQCVSMRHLDELSYEEIAELLDITVGAAKTNASLGKQRLRDIMTTPRRGERT